MLLDQKAYPHLVYHTAREMLQYELQNLELGYERPPTKKTLAGMKDILGGSGPLTKSPA